MDEAADVPKGNFLNLYATVLLSSALCHRYAYSASLPYENPLPKYNKEQLIGIFLDPKLDRQHVWITWPIAVESGSTFVLISQN